MIVTLTGNNDFARDRELTAIVSAFIAEHGEFGLEKLDGEESEADRLSEAVHSAPFLTSRKLVILRQPSKQKEFAQSIGDILAGVPDTTDVILVEPKLDKRLSYYKTLKKQTDFREYNELDAAALARWATAYTKEQGGTLGRAEAQALISRVGTNQQLLQNELDKLLMYAPRISRENIELLTERLPQSTVFELLDAAFNGKTGRALQLYREQRALRVEPQAIIAMLAWQLHVLAVVKAGRSGRPADEIARAAKLNPFVVRKSQGLARAIGMPRLRLLIGDLMRLDIRLKRSSIDADEAVQLYLLKLQDEQPAHKKPAR